jgi:hypothetical protein
MFQFGFDKFVPRRQQLKITAEEPIQIVGWYFGQRLVLELPEPQTTAAEFLDDSIAQVGADVGKC